MYLLVKYLRKSKGVRKSRENILTALRRSNTLCDRAQAINYLAVPNLVSCRYFKTSAENIQLPDMLNVRVSLLFGTAFRTTLISQRKFK